MKHGGSKTRNKTIKETNNNVFPRWIGAPPRSLIKLPNETIRIRSLRHRRNGIDRYSDQNGNSLQKNTDGIKKVHAVWAANEPDKCIKTCSRSGLIEISDQNGIMPNPAAKHGLNKPASFSPK